MTAEEYVKREWEAGRLTAVHVVELVKFYQDNHSLTVDGKPGPATRKELEERMGLYSDLAPPFLYIPMPVLAGGRRAEVTSGFGPRGNPPKQHNGLDFFYRWKKGDKPSFVGNGGAAGFHNGLPKWVVPYGVEATAAAGGVVQIAGDTNTGYRTWIDHGNGWRTGYFHLISLRHKIGDRVCGGEALGPIGDNPNDRGDGRHLHFELSPVDRYAPVDPEPYLVR